MHPDLIDTLRMLRDEHESVRLAALFMEDVIYRRRGTARLPLREIAQGTGLSKDTTHRVVRRLMNLGFIQQMKSGIRGNGSVYAMSGRIR